MFRQTASRLISTATATGRFAIRLPLGIAHSVLERVIPHGDSGSQAPTSKRSAGSVSRPAQQAPQPSAEEQATAAVGKTGAAAGTRSVPAARKASTPKAGDVTPDDDGPEVVLAVDSPPQEVEPPVDVVGEALAAEGEHVEPPAEVDDEHSVVYSTSTDER